MLERGQGMTIMVNRPENEVDVEAEPTRELAPRFTLLPAS